MYKFYGTFNLVPLQEIHVYLKIANEVIQFSYEMLTDSKNRTMRHTIVT